MRIDRSSQGVRVRGIVFTLLSTVFFGTAPIFGKLAYRAQVLPFTLVALRTVLAAATLWVFYLVFWRKAIRITWQNLMGCIGMGVANGVGLPAPSRVRMFSRRAWNCVQLDVEVTSR